MGTPFLVDIKRLKDNISNRSACNLIDALSAGNKYFTSRIDPHRYEFQDCHLAINNLIRQTYFQRGGNVYCYFAPEMYFKFDPNAGDNRSKIVYQHSRHF